MPWYVAKIVYRIICGSGQHTAQYEEQLRLVQAASLAQAWAKAQAMGQAATVQFFNERKQLVQWKWVGIPELTELGNLVDGLELASRIEEQEQGAAYEDWVQSKAAMLEEKLTERVCMNAW